MEAMIYPNGLYDSRIALFLPSEWQGADAIIPVRNHAGSSSLTTSNYSVVFTHAKGRLLTTRARSISAQLVLYQGQSLAVKLLVATHLARLHVQSNTGNLFPSLALVEFIFKHVFAR